MQRPIAPVFAVIAFACALVCAIGVMAPWSASAADAGGSAATPVDSTQIDTYLAGKGSPMAGSGSAFIASGGRWQVDPRLIVAIAGAESSFGAITCAPFNAWGYGCPNGPYHFDSWADGIDTVAKGLRENYLAEGRTSVALINLKYAPLGAANDPTGLNNHWTINVSRFLIELGGDPSDIDLAGVGGTRLLGLPGTGGGEDFGFEEAAATSDEPSDALKADLEVAAGAPKTLVVEVKNTGAATWTPSDVRLIRTDAEPRVVGAPYGALLDDSIAPGNMARFGVALAAAGANDGTATTSWRLEGPGGPFGSTIERTVSFEVPAYVAGESRVEVEATNGGVAGTTSTWAVVVHVRNAGSQAWERDGANGVVLGLSDEPPFTMQRIGWISDDIAARMLERRVEPGEEGSFAFRVAGETGEFAMVAANNAGFAPGEPLIVRIGP